MVNIEAAGAFALNRIFIYEPGTVRAVIRRLGSSCELFKLDGDALAGILGPFNKHKDDILSVNLDEEAEKLEKICRENNCTYLSYDCGCFPDRLEECPDAPVGIFFKSCDSPENVFGRESVSIVGTRDISPYGKQWAEKLVRGLSMTDMRPTVVSGLAFGVDITAQSCALDCGLPTIAVMGTGIDCIYPHQHELYARKIIERPLCAIVSEYPPDIAVNPLNFLSRNRIVAGLSRATVLVESKLKGGGMTTARMAFSYDREVYAVPGRNDDVRSQGCNSLIHAHIAAPVISCESFLEDLDYKYKSLKKVDLGRQIRDFYSGNLDVDRIKLAVELVGIIKKSSGVTADELALKTGVSVSRVASVLSRLESDGFISVDLLQRCTVGNKSKVGF